MRGNCLEAGTAYCRSGELHLLGKVQLSSHRAGHHSTSPREVEPQREMKTVGARSASQLTECPSSHAESREAIKPVYFNNQNHTNSSPLPRGENFFFPERKKTSLLKTSNTQKGTESKPLLNEIIILPFLIKQSIINVSPFTFIMQAHLPLSFLEAASLRPSLTQPLYTRD